MRQAWSRTACGGLTDPRLSQLCPPYVTPSSNAEQVSARLVELLLPRDAPIRVHERVRDFLARRHKVAGRGTHRFSCEVVYGELGLLRLELGEPDAGDRHVRFDERG